MRMKVDPITVLVLLAVFVYGALKVDQNTASLTQPLDKPALVASVKADAAHVAKVVKTAVKNSTPGGPYNQ